jgi:hypothetical protein
MCAFFNSLSGNCHAYITLRLCSASTNHAREAIKSDTKDGISLDQQRYVVVIFWAKCSKPIRSCKLDSQSSLPEILGQLRECALRQAQNTMTTSLCQPNKIYHL